MGCVKIDNKLNKSEEMANFFLFLLNENRITMPKLSLFQILLAKTRPGLDSDVTTSNITSRFEEIGIPTGPLDSGQPNVVEQLVQVIVEEIFDSVQSDMRIDAAVEQGLMVVSSGANAAGPVASTGANPMPGSSTAVAS